MCDDDLASRGAAVLDELRSRAAVDPEVEREFNHRCEAKHLGLHLHHGRFYPDPIGQSHSSVLTGPWPADKRGSNR